MRRDEKAEIYLMVKISRLVYRIGSMVSRVYSLLIKREFDRLEGATIWWNVKLDNVSHMSVGRGVTVRSGSWLYAVVSDQCGHKLNPRIEIQDGVYLGHRLHLTAVDRVTIEVGAMIADGVYISDNIHDYHDVNVPIQRQAVVSKGPLSIGAGAFVGEGARIVGPVRVGRNSVVGANAVVTKDIPDFSVAVGIPATVIRTYDKEQDVWKPVGQAER